MSTQLVLEKRTVQGKQLKALRAAGKIPSAVYGEIEPQMAASDYNATAKVLAEVGYHSPVELELDGKKQLAIVKDVAINPVSRRIMNIEFQAISASEVVEATTPIKVTGFDDSEAAKKHFVLMQVLEEIEVKAKPSDLPQELVLDGSKLASVEDKLTIANLKLPQGVELADKELAENTVIANVYDPAVEAAAREAEEAQPTAEAAETPAAEEAAKAE